MGWKNPTQKNLQNFLLKTKSGETKKNPSDFFVDLDLPNVEAWRFFQKFLPKKYVQIESCSKKLQKVVGKNGVPGFEAPRARI